MAKNSVKPAEYCSVFFEQCRKFFTDPGTSTVRRTRYETIFDLRSTKWQNEDLFPHDSRSVSYFWNFLTYYQEFPYGPWRIPVHLHKMFDEPVVATPFRNNVLVLL